MLSWLIRLLLAAAALITGLFVAEDASNFGLIQTAVAILLVVFLLAAAVFWPSLVQWLRSRQ